MHLLPELKLTSNSAKVGLLASTTAAPIATPSVEDAVAPPNGNGHHNGHHNGHRRRRHQIRDGVRQAALQADTGLLLVRQHGFSIADAARRTASNPAAIAAMGILHDYGDLELLTAVLVGEVPFLPTAARIKPLVKAKRAYDALSDLDRIEFARREDPEKLFEVIVSASAPAQVNLVVET